MIDTFDESTRGIDNGVIVLLPATTMTTHLRSAGRDAARPTMNDVAGSAGVSLGALPAPTTAWSVDPVGDRQHFDQWLNSVDRVVEMKFIFERPNPDAEAGFQFLFERLDKLGAGQIVDRVTPSDKGAGLNKEGIREDRISQAYITAAMMAFGYVVGRGYRGGQKSNYDQRNDVLRERVNDVGATWDDAKNTVVKATRRAVGRRKKNG